jgi:hypothetical protein
VLLFPSSRPPDADKSDYHEPTKNEPASMNPLQANHKEAGCNNDEVSRRLFSDASPQPIDTFAPAENQIDHHHGPESVQIDGPPTLNPQKNVRTTKVDNIDQKKKNEKKKKKKRKAEDSTFFVPTHNDREVPVLQFPSSRPPDADKSDYHEPTKNEPASMHPLQAKHKEARCSLSELAKRLVSDKSPQAIDTSVASKNQTDQHVVPDPFQIDGPSMPNGQKNTPTSKVKKAHKKTTQKKNKKRKAEGSTSFVPTHNDREVPVLLLPF